MTQRTAKQANDEAIKSIDERLAMLQKYVKQQQGKSVNWGDVGSNGHVNHLLKQACCHLGIETDPDY